MIARGIGCIVVGIGLIACGARPEDAGETGSPGSSDDRSRTSAIEPKVDPPQGVPSGLPAPEREMRCSATDAVDSMKEAGTPELYFPEAMKRKLVKYPLLHERTGLSEVKTCSDARVFMRSYKTLLEERPDLFVDNAISAQLAALKGRPESEDIASVNGPVLGPEPDNGDEDIGVTRQPILNGALTTQWSTVMVAQVTNQQIVNWCSGLSISKFHSLTSAHCLGGVPNGWFRGALYRQACVNGQCWLIPTLYTEMWLYMSRHPDYTGGGDWNDDLAIVTIYHIYDDGTVTFPDPAAGNAMRIWLGSLGAGQAVNVYGYGAANASGGGVMQLRVGSMNLAAVNPAYFWANVGNQSTCLGDSGGPAVVNADKGAGLASAQSSPAPCPPAGGWVTWTRLSPKMSWLEGQMWYPFGTGYTCPKFGSGASLYARCW